jgi:hypothetical protein
MVASVQTPDMMMCIDADHVRVCPFGSQAAIIEAAYTRRVTHLGAKIV